MSIFLIIVLSLFAANFVWWVWSDAMLRRLGTTARAWRWAVALWTLTMAGLFAVEMLDRNEHLPLLPLIAVYVWHLVVLPAVLFCLVAAGGFSTLAAAVRLIRPRTPLAEPATLPDALTPTPAGAIAASATLAGGSSRRQFLGAAFVAAGPPLLHICGVTTAALNLSSFRVRRIAITYANLPRGLDGVTIAHLSDTHFGPFTTRADVRHIVDATNRFAPDVVVFTGDLINSSLDELSAGLDMLRGLRPRAGIVTIEGNHDLFQDRRAFEDGVRNAGFPLLLNESHLLRVGPAGYPMNLLGLQWGKSSIRRDPNLQEWSRVTLAQKNPDAFNILLAHHPHAFDHAAAADVPLTLAGHTHGGQLMAMAGLGAGPLMYKYWSGLYRHSTNPNAACVVSNGIGNWFPLRVNAPAELVLVTLQKA